MPVCINNPDSELEGSLSNRKKKKKKKREKKKKQEFEYLINTKKCKSVQFVIAIYRHDFFFQTN